MFTTISTDFAMSKSRSYRQ